MMFKKLFFVLSCFAIFLTPILGKGLISAQEIKTVQRVCSDGLVLKASLCVPQSANVGYNCDLGVLHVSYWHSVHETKPGGAPQTWFSWFEVQEGNWRVINLAAMNHSSETREITLMVHHGTEWLAIGNKVMSRQFEWIFAQDKPLVWPGTKIGVVWRDFWFANNDALFMNAILERVE